MYVHVSLYVYKCPTASILSNKTISVNVLLKTLTLSHHTDYPHIDMHLNYNWVVQHSAWLFSDADDN